MSRPARAERWQLASAALAGWRGRTTGLLGVAAAVGGFFGAPHLAPTWRVFWHHNGPPCGEPGADQITSCHYIG